MDPAPTETDSTAETGTRLLNGKTILKDANLGFCSFVQNASSRRVYIVQSKMSNEKETPSRDKV